MKNVIVTGSNRGLGLAICKRFLKDPNVQVIGTIRSGIHPISNERFKPMYLNLENSESIQLFAKEIANLKVDVLINNAGVLLESGTETSIDMKTLKTTFSVNLFGVIELTELLIAQLVSGAHLVNITSSWGSYTSEDFDDRFPAYRMSKAGLNMYSKTLTKRLESNSIEVLNYNPGWIQTDMGGPNATESPENVAAALYNKIIQNE